MKNIKIFLLTICCCIGFLACGDDELKLPTVNPNPGGSTGGEKEDIEFRVLVYIDRPSVDGHLGGERVMASKMNTLFRQATNFWNESSKGKLKHNYTYTVADIKIYEGSSNDPDLNNEYRNGPYDFNKYDVTVFFDCKQDFDETGNGGASCGGGANNRTIVWVMAGQEEKNIFEDNTYKTLVHELGHFRGVTDLYQYIVAANDNPVSNQKFDPPACIMVSTSDGVWSDYAANFMNFTGSKWMTGEKRGLTVFNDSYPKKIEITATVDGEAKRGVSVKVYGLRAGTRDIWPTAFLEGVTNTNGKYILNDSKQYYIPDKSKFPNFEFPERFDYGRWFGFLAEFEYKSVKKYVWMPEYLVQMPYFDGKDTYEASVSF